LKAVNKKWCFELDDQDDDDHHLIAYDAVCEYANKQHSTFNRYQLPSELVLEDDDEIETEDGMLYSLTPTEEWSQVDDDDCNAQQIDYCSTYHKIDKGNGAEAKYDLSTESHLHGWGPKLAARYFNMNLNNTAKLYHRLVYKKVHHPLIPMPLKEGIHNLTHSLLQRGDSM
jgi:hypothetical protein